MQKARATNSIVWHFRVAVAVVAVLTVITPADAQLRRPDRPLRYDPPSQGIEAPLSWLQEFNGAYTRPQARPDDSLSPTGALIQGMDAVVIPLLQPWAAMRREATDFEIEEEGVICRPTGLLLAHVNRGFYLVASPGRLTFVGDGPHTAATRRIYLDRGHLKNPPLTSWGDSIAYREGDTLVIDTIGFDDKSFLSLDATRHSTELHIVERWRLVADGKYLEKVWTVDDPRALKAPFTFTRYHSRMPVDGWHPERPCTNTPDNWRAWVTLYNDGVRFHQEQRPEAVRAVPPEGQ